MQDAYAEPERCVHTSGSTEDVEFLVDVSISHCISRLKYIKAWLVFVLFSSTPYLHTWTTR